MPLINVKMLSGRTQETKNELVDVLTKETCRVLKVKPEAVWIVIDEYSKDSWAEGGQFFSQKIRS